MTFSGLAIYDTGVFTTIADDVSDMISMISPWETPLLDALTQAPRVAQNILHEWMEEELGPNTLSVSVQYASNTTSVVPHVAGTVATPFLQVGMVLENETSGEQMQISAVAAGHVTIIRSFGATTAATILVTDNLFIVSDAALEGADVDTDISRPRSRVTNYCQFFKKDIIVSGTMQAVNKLGGIANEYDHQKMMRTRESIRDLEKATIRGKVSGNTIGGNAVANTRTMKGMWSFIATNATSTNTLTATILDDVIKLAWDNGGQTNLIVVDAAWKRTIDSWNSSRIEVMQGSAGDQTYMQRVTYYEGTFGTHKVLMNRWMPGHSLMVLDSTRCHVVPLQGRSFQHVPTARTGDSEKGMVIGEYTVEVKNEKGMSKAYGGA